MTSRTRAEQEAAQHPPGRGRSYSASGNRWWVGSRTAEGVEQQLVHHHLIATSALGPEDFGLVKGGNAPLFPGPHATKIRRPLLGG